MGATTPLQQAFPSPNQVSLFKEAAIKSQHIDPSFLLLPLAYNIPQNQYLQRIIQGN